MFATTPRRENLRRSRTGNCRVPRLQDSPDTTAVVIIPVRPVFARKCHPSDQQAPDAPIWTLRTTAPAPGATFASLAARPRSVRKRRCSRRAVVAIRMKPGRDDDRASVNPGLFVMPMISIREVVESCRRLVGSSAEARSNVASEHAYQHFMIISSPRGASGRAVRLGSGPVSDPVPYCEGGSTDGSRSAALGGSRCVQA
jgi:hypothetical protein